ncbi:hypothetical protein [Rhodococcus sp. NPDC058481]
MPPIDLPAMLNALTQAPGYAQDTGFVGSMIGLPWGGQIGFGS